MKNKNKNKNKKFIFIFAILALISLPIFSSLSLGVEGNIDVEIISSTDTQVEGRIKNFSNYAKELELDKIVIIGTKKVNKNTTNIDWQELSLNNQKSLISSDFKSKIIVKEQGALTKGDSFKAKGNYRHLASAIEDLLGKDIGNALNSNKESSGGLSEQASYGEGGYSTSGQSSSTGLNQTTPNAVPDSTLGESTITNQGCRPRVDYELNQVYIQQRVLLNGSQIESCSDSLTSFKLEKDYVSCPVDINVSAKEISYFYQYFYTDANGTVNVIGNCEKDPLKTKPLQIIKDYNSCANFIDFSAMKVFRQFREFYKDQNNQDVLLRDCTIDSSKNYAIKEDYNSCPIKKDPVTGDSIIQSKYTYNQDGVEVLISDCADKAIITSTGCTPRVDYELNQVFIQQRTLLNGEEIEGCRDSSTKFSLNKDYDSCPVDINLSAKEIRYFFQYFYTDGNGGNNVIGSCKNDPTKTKALQITKDYNNCTNFVDLFAMKVYKQFKEFYKDQNDQDILLNDCAIDYSKNYNINEDYDSCPIKHNFTSGFSVAQSKFTYIQDGVEITISDCTNTSTKYQHSTTSDTCSSVVTGGTVQLFNRKYITVSGVRNYITECTPISGSVTIQTENCTQNEFTHDFVTKQSYRNKNYFYIDNNGQRNEIFSCVKSEETFNHQEDTSVCIPQDDDITKTTTLSSKTFILVDATREYIGSCKTIPTKISYTEIGYKWKNDFANTSTAITVANSGDNVFLGSKEGVENTSRDFYSQTTIINKYNIALYSTAGKCEAWTSPSYIGTPIDLTLSDRTSITKDNYVENRAAANVCYWDCWVTNYNPPSCNDLRRTCSNGNILYYQRCTNYKCPLTKVLKLPIYRRGSGSTFVDEGINLGIKYICGNSTALNNTEVLY